MTDEELVDEVLSRLWRFSPAIAIERNDDLDEDQIELSITMNRTPLD